MDQLPYDQLLNQDFNFISCDILDVKQKIDQPVVLKNCSHPRQCFTYSEATASWQSKKEIQCSACGQKTNDFNDLRKDLRQQVYEQFHQSVEQVQIIEGILMHKYHRKRRYAELIQQVNQEIPGFLIEMKKRFIFPYSINFILQKKYPFEDRITYLALCLLDKIKIIIPVRLVGCDHPECYELTSLLSYYWQFIRQEQQEYKGQFRCVHSGCQNSIKIFTINDLINGIVLDLDLLNVLNKCEPCQFKFIQQPLQNKFNYELTNVQDPFIIKLFQSQLNEQEKNSILFDSFKSQIQSQIACAIQLDIQPQQEKRLNMEKFQCKTIDMIDPLTGLLIEFPVRCTQCTSYDRCIDIRSFVGSHILAKIRKQPFSKCLICGWQYKSHICTLSSNIMYTDLNLLLKISQVMQQQQTTKFKYNGKQYMLEQFLLNQKLNKEDYISELKGQNNDLISKFQITWDSQKIVEIPLINKNCPENSIVDFETFYKLMQEINFNIEDYGLRLCLCKTCNQTSIKDYKKYIFYHEAFGEALTEYKKMKLKLNTFHYDFGSKKIIIQYEQAKIRMNNSLLATEKYQFQINSVSFMFNDKKLTVVKGHNAKISMQAENPKE